MPADRVTPARTARDDRKPGVGIAIGADVGDAAHDANAVDTVLVGGPGEEMAEPPARCLEERARVAVGKAPGCLADPGAGRVARVEGSAPDA